MSTRRLRACRSGGRDRNCPADRNRRRWSAYLLDRLDTRGRWALLKLVGGAPRVGVSARLAKTALAEIGAEAGPTVSVSDIEEIWHALEPPYTDLFLWLEGKGPRPDAGGKPVFRPLMLAHAIEDQDWASFAPDGLRRRMEMGRHPRADRGARRPRPHLLAHRRRHLALVPRDRLGIRGRDVLADGELLVARRGVVAAFNDLQQRLNRKVVTGKMLKDHPAHVRLYDLLIVNGEPA